MASLTEQLNEEATRKAKDAVKMTEKTMKLTSKGIALILNGTVLSEDSIMRALDKKIEKSGDFKLSYKNVSMEELQKGGKVEKVDELMLQESMRYFDKYCREYGVKYSALKTKEEEKEGYMIFFEGKNDKLMLEIMKKAVTDWTKDQEKMKEAGIDAAQTSRPSVLAKLTFFRNRVKEFVENDKSTEQKHEKVRQPDLER